MDPYIIINCHWPNISLQYVLRTSKRRVYQHSPWHKDYCIYGALCCSILIWDARPNKPYLLILLQQILHKLWVIEDTIISVVSLGCQSITLSLPLKVEVCVDIFSRVYSHLVLNAYITTGMVNKNTSALEHIIWIWLALCVVYTTCIPRDILIFRHHISRQKMKFIEILLLHRIFLGCLYFTRPKLNLSKLTGRTLWPLKIATDLDFVWHLQTPCEN